MLRSIQDGPGDQSRQDSFAKVEVVNVKPEPNFYDQEETQLDTADKGDIYYDITKSEYEVQTIYWSGTPIKKRDGKTVLNGVVKEEIVKEEKEEEVCEVEDAVVKVEEDADYSDLHVIESFVLKSEEDEAEDNNNESSNSQNHDVKFESVDVAISDVEGTALKKKPDPFLQKKHHFFESYFIRACPICDTDFENLSTWKAHMDNVHNHNKRKYYNEYYSYTENGKAKCNSCNIIFSSKLHSLRMHSLMHLPYRKFLKCKLCPETKSQLSSIIKHIKKQHLGHLQEQSIHIQTQHAGLYKHKILYVCPVCGVNFATKNCWKEHLNQEHKFNSLGGLSFELLDQHNPSTTNHMKYRCMTCKMIYLSTSPFCLLHNHALQHLPFKVFKCSYCDYAHSKKLQIIKHACEACPKANPQLAGKTPSKTQKNVQRILDTNETLYICPSCGEHFEEVALWVVHLTRAHKLDRIESLNIKITLAEDGNRKYSCLICDKDLSKANSYNIRTHAFSHMAHKIYKCKICHSAFNKKPCGKCASSSEFADTGKSKKHSKRKKYKKSESASDPFCDPLQLESNNVPNFAQTKIAIRTEKTIVWNQYEEHITYACPECNLPLATNEDWHAHINSRHDFFSEKQLKIAPIAGLKQKWLCEECGVTVHGCLLHAQRHKLVHMPYRAFICCICQHRSKTQNVLIHHIKRQHFTSGSFKCIFCSLIFGTYYERFIHAKAEHSDAEWPDNVCRVCMKSLQTRLTLARHMKSHDFDQQAKICHSEFNIMPACNSKQTNGERECRTTVSAESKNIIYGCPQCGEDFRTEQLWNIHIVKEHDLHEPRGLNFSKISDGGDGISIYKCSVCDELVKTSTSLSQALFNHASIKHMPFKSYKCGACGEMCTRKDDILIHVNNCKVSEDFNKSSEDKTAAVNKNTESACEDHVNLKIYPEGDMLRHIENKHTGTELKLPHEEQPFKSYKCGACGEMCTRKDDILIHVNNCKVSEDFNKSSEDKTAAVNKNTESACEDHVNLKIYPEGDMLRHIENKHTGTELKLPHEEQPFKSYKCGACGEMCTRKDDILIHVNNCKVSEDFNKSSEDKTAAVNKNTESACEDHVNLKIYPEGDMLGHIENKHTGTELKLPHEEQPFKSYKCGACGEMCTRKDDILIHVNNCKVSEDFNKSSEDKTAAVNKNTESACEDHVNLKMYPEEDMLRHIENKHTGTQLKLPHEEQLYKCSNCDMSFSNLLYSQQHAAKCTGEVKSSLAMLKRKIEYPLGNTGKSKEHKKRKKGEKSESVIDPFCDILRNETNIAIRTVKTFLLNQFEDYITYACPECNLPLANNEAWHAHINSRHDFFSEKQLKIAPIAGEKQMWLCQECGSTVYGGLLTAQKHKLVHLPYRAFICSICQHRSKTQTMMISHIKRQHFTFGSFIRCIFCSATFGTSYERSIHTKAEHCDAKWPNKVCRVCMKSFRKRSYLAEHMKLHDPDRVTYSCGYCKRKFCSSYERKIHWIQHHSKEYSTVQADQQAKVSVQSQTDS